MRSVEPMNTKYHKIEIEGSMDLLISFHPRVPFSELPAASFRCPYQPHYLLFVRVPPLNEPSDDDCREMTLI